MFEKDQPQLQVDVKPIDDPQALEESKARLKCQSFIKS